MNGVHDMGGMHGMGPIRYVKSEPVFHAPWEGRALAMVRAVQATGKIGGSLRPAIENIPAAEYLRISYYEKWFLALVERLVESDLVTRDEIENGRPAKGSAKAVPALTQTNAATYPMREVSARRNIPAAARFQAGQRVRARNLHPVTHTRLPRYVRGKVGTIEHDRGVIPFPDTNVYRLGEKPQYVYSVCFAARELWGDQAAPQDAVYIEMWEDHLESA